MPKQLRQPIQIILRARRKQVGFRLGTATVIMLCYGQLLGWPVMASWLAIYMSLQLADLLCLSTDTRLAAPLSRTAAAIALATITLNSVVFGSLSLVVALRMGSWGSACAAYLVAGAMLNTVLTTIESKAAFTCSIAPFVAFSFAAPLITLYSSVPPSPWILAGLCLGGAMLTLSATSLWRDGRLSKDAEAAAIARDLAERASSEQRLYRLAHQDSLTGLSNRLVLQTHLANLTASPHSAALLLIDLDGFKFVNDTLGHSAGDGVLCEVAKRLVACVSPGSLCVRLGGDEFALLLPQIADRSDPAVLAQQIIAAISEPLVLEGRSVNIGASIGIALHPQDGDNAEILFASADLALYQAKNEGRHCTRYFSQNLKAEALNKMSRDAELQLALERGEFELFYQPQAGLVDGRLTGAEALLRWRHPKEGLLTPGSFLPALENGRLAAQVGEWVMLTACRQAAIWRRHHAPNFRMGVNLFGAQFRSGNLAQKTLDVLRQTDLPPCALELEITENIILRYEDDIVEPLRSLRESGVGIAFDDYGTGYASLSLLKRYPLSRLKIDQSFTRAACNSAADAAIISAIFSMGSAFNLSVIAEGVETPAQAGLLRQLGCEEVQGYYLGHPVSAEAFAAAHLHANGVLEELSGLATAPKYSLLH